LGNEGLAALLPYLQTTALSRVNRKSASGLKKTCSELRTAVSAATNVEAPKLEQLRRVAPSSILIAGFTIFGMYLLIGQFANVQWSAMFNDAQWVWVPVVFALAWVPIGGIALSLLGSVSKPLPLRPVLMLEIGTKFTGLAGGGVTTFALLVRFFQKQGLKSAVAVTSSLLNSVASGFTEIVFLLVALIFGASSFSLSKGGSGGASGLSGKILLAALVLALLATGVIKDSAKAEVVTPVKAISYSVPKDCMSTDVLAALQKDVRQAQFIDTPWQPAPGTELADFLNNGGIACSYGMQSEAIGLTVDWVADGTKLFNSRTAGWLGEGYQKIDIPNLMETDAYFLQKDQSATNEFSQYQVKFLINGFWINLSSTFGKTIEDGSGWIKAAVDSL
jgi:hypothetical protein